METLATTGLGLMCVSCLAVGVRLARIHLRTGERPELLASVALLALGPMGFVLSVVGVPADRWIPGLGPVTWALASVSLAVGTLSVAVFTTSVFQPGSAGARGASAAVGLALGICFAGEWIQTGFWVDRPASAFTRIADWIRTAVILWGAVASLQAFSAAKKRVALGLGRPANALRVGLWGVGLLSVAAVSVLDSAVKSAPGLPPTHVANAMWVINSTAGSIAALALHLSFLPGAARVTTWLEGRLVPAPPQG